ncbi:MAG: hypothetical protein KDD53_01650 [Bdellovibrionales bacterium]|nr:hypothetical protein [Bdellovibrionales bacterium]
MGKVAPKLTVIDTSLNARRIERSKSRQRKNTHLSVAVASSEVLCSKKKIDHRVEELVDALSVARAFAIDAGQGVLPDRILLEFRDLLQDAIFAIDPQRVYVGSYSQFQGCAGALGMRGVVIDVEKGLIQLLEKITNLLGSCSELQGAQIARASVKAILANLD